MGTPTQKKFTHFLLLWGLIEMQWLQHSVPKSLPNEISQKYQNSIHM